MKYFIPSVYRFFEGYMRVTRRNWSKANEKTKVQQIKSQNISHLGIINIPINITFTVSLVSHHTDNILMVKFRKEQFPESFVAYITSGWQTRCLHVLHQDDKYLLSAFYIGLGHAFQNSQVFVCSFALVSNWSKNKRGPASLLFKPEIWSAGADNGKTTIVIDSALPPQNTETFRFPTCFGSSNACYP